MMENNNKPIPAIGLHMLTVYAAGAGMLLNGSENMDSGQIDYSEIRRMIDNYRQILLMYEKIIGKDETKIHEEAIGKLERFFEISR